MRKLLAIPAVMVMLGAAALLGAAPAVAGTTTTQVNISPQAQMWAFSAGQNGIFVSVTFTCSGGTGTVSLTATQTSAQSNSGSSANGSGGVDAKCDGKSHKVTQSLVGFGFQQGTATVSATLTAPSGTATDEKVVDVNQP
jgi:hypothetical protein